LPSIIGKAWCCSRIFFNWGGKFITRAKKVQLSLNDFGGLRKDDMVQKKLAKFNRIYDQ
jgi:hypothetical protein